MKKLIPSLVLISLLGAGCPTTKAPTPSAPSTKSTPAPAPRLGFGKLPALNPKGDAGSVSFRSSASGVAAPTAAPMAVSAVAPMAANTVAVEGVAAADAKMAPGRMIAPYEPQNQQEVEYTVTATLPDWEAESAVLHVRRPGLDTGVIRTLAVPAGLPSALAGQIKSVQGINMSWTDQDSLTWNFDPAYGNLNWWKMYDPRIAEAEARRAEEFQKNRPKIDNARILAAADAFLNAHGLGFIREQGGEVDPMEWMAQSESARPCIMMKEQPVDAAASTMIYPSPCAWYPTEVAVFYGTKLENRGVVDAGGWPFRMSSVQVSLIDYSVRGGNVQIGQDLERSNYPLISKEAAMKALQAGGRNPVYGWGDTKTKVSATITKVELVWMRFDSYTDNKQEAYYLPALAAEGKVDRKIPGQEPEIYRTVVPLVTDESFDLNPDQGGTPVPMPLMMEAAPAVAPEPKR
jgi:hypothetical protein